MSKHYNPGPFYRRWTWIRQAINNPRSPDYHYGQHLDFDWMDNYAEFEEYILAHLGHPPADKHYLNRRDQSRGWVAGNLYWADGREMGNNHPGYNRMIRYQNETLTISAASYKYNINIFTLLRRLALGWTPEEAIETPIRPLHRRKKTVSYAKNNSMV